MAKAGSDFSRCYHGTIRRAIDENKDQIVYGKIKVDDGYIYARACDQWKLGEKLDLIVLMILDYGLHDNVFKSSTVAESDIYLN